MHPVEGNRPKAAHLCVSSFLPHLFFSVSQFLVYIQSLVLGWFTGVLFCSGVGPFGFVLILDRILSPLRNHLNQFKKKSFSFDFFGDIQLLSTRKAHSCTVYSSFMKHEVSNWLAGASSLVPSLAMSHFHMGLLLFETDCRQQNLFTA